VKGSTANEIEKEEIKIHETISGEISHFTRIVSRGLVLLPVERDKSKSENGREREKKTENKLHVRVPINFNILSINKWSKKKGKKNMHKTMRCGVLRGGE
jgi:hypothetical protein